MEIDEDNTTTAFGSGDNNDNNSNSLLDEMNNIIGNGNDELPPPRLMITKMVLENFKSYGGVKEIGPFHKCFSSIVGPNGSGKSNVIDAMLFVFGKRAKKLRLNKVSELIHKSEGCKDNPPNFARVSVYFNDIVDTGDGDEDYEILPNTEHIVTRIAYKNNTSTYKLDNKNCSFKDVSTYLNSKGIDLDNNRFLILQGEVELISMMPPKGKTENDEGLLEYLEDIIGSNQYVDDTLKAQEHVDQLTEVRQEKLNRVKAIEKEKDNLVGAKMEAEALLGKERDIRRKKNILYQINMMTCKKESDVIQEKKEVIDQQLEKERFEMTEITNRLNDIENKKTGQLTKQKKEYDKIYKELQQTKDEFTSYERQDIQLREEMKHLKQSKKKHEGKIKTEGKKVDDLIKKIDDATTSIPTIEEKIQECKDSKDVEDEKLNSIYDEMKGITDKLRIQLEDKTKELSPLVQERAVYQSNLDTATTELQLIQDNTQRAKSTLSDVQKELSTLDGKQEKKRNELSAAEDELTECKQRIVDATAEEEQLATKEQTLAKRNKELLLLAEEAKASLQANKNSSNRSKAVTAMLKASKTKGTELYNIGILGRLGDLATINEEYDVAVSTACGMLDHMVVQTTAGVQRCLEYLRKNNLGRANFIPLDKMKKGIHDRQIDTPEGAPRLFELITPSSSMVTPAIHLAVGNTLVAPDLEVATRLAYDYSKRWRVVTLDGQLIELSGTMAGGGKSVRKGGMKLTNARSGSAAVSAGVSMDDIESINDCKKLEADAVQGQKLLQECRKRRKELTDEMRTLKKRVKTLTQKIPKLSMEIGDCDTTREELTQRLPELQSQCELTDEEQAKVDELTKKVRKCKTDMSSCAMQASKLEADVARLQKAILDAGGTKLKKQQKLCSDAQKALNDAEKELSAAKVSIKSNEKSVKKAEKAKSSAEDELTTCIASLEDKQKEYEKIEADAFKVMEAYEKVKSIEKEKREELELITKECEELKKSQSKMKCSEIDLLGKVETYEKQITDYAKRIQSWDDEINKLHAAAEEDDYDIDEDDEGEGDNDGSGDPSSSENENGEKIKEDENDTGNEEDVEMVDVVDGDSATKTSKQKQGGTCLPTLPFESLEQYSVDEVKNDIDILEEEHKSLSKNANMGAIAEYRKKEVDYLARVGELDKVTEERNKARTAHEELRRLRLEKFMDGFGQITLKLKEMYQMITLGGDAELELVDSLDPFSEGIVFSVRPPKKSWKNIANLSGGEKTLSSLALVFALHHYKPTPLYVMDEIDAALDFKNVSIVANYIKERTKNAQFVIISLRNNMFELADRLVGIYKTNNSTKSITIDPKAFGKAAEESTSQSAPLADKTNTKENAEVNTSSKRRLSAVPDLETGTTLGA